jgi:hypothetical protein
VLAQHAVSLTCELSREPGMQWFLTKESGLMPRTCSGAETLLGTVPGVLQPRPRLSLFALKVAGAQGEEEVLVVPFLLSTVEWFEKTVLKLLLESVRSGSWTEVQHLVSYLECCPPCVAGCGDGECTCRERLVWNGRGWHRVRGVEWTAPRREDWWKGVTDALGELSKDGKPWLRCCCGLHQG